MGAEGEIKRKERMMKRSTVKAVGTILLGICLMWLQLCIISQARAMTDVVVDQGVEASEQDGEVLGGPEDPDASEDASAISLCEESSDDVIVGVQPDDDPVEVSGTNPAVASPESNDYSGEKGSLSAADGNAESVAKEARANANSSSTISYRTHVQNVGWQGWRSNGDVSGTSGRSLRLEGIKIELSGKPVSGGIKYRTQIQGIGWQGWRSNGAMSGTSGQSRRLEAIKIKLTGNMAKRFDVYYRVHAQSFGWMGWAKNGASAGTEGYSYRLEAIQVVLVAKGGSAPSASYKGVWRSTKAAFKKKAKSITLGGKYHNWKMELPEYWTGKVNVYRYDTYYGAKGETVVVMPKGYSYSRYTWQSYYLLAVHAGPIDGYFNPDKNTRTAKLKSGQRVTIYHEDHGSGSMRFVEPIPSGERHPMLDVSTLYYAPRLHKVWSLAQIDDANALAKLQKSGKHTYSLSMSDRETAPLTCLKTVAARTSIW